MIPMITSYENMYGLFLSPKHLIKRTKFCPIYFHQHLFVLIRQYLLFKIKVKFHISFDISYKVEKFTSDSIIKTFILALDYQHATGYAIYDIYKINENSRDVKMANYGHWNGTNGLKVIEKNIWKRRHNLMGHHIR